MRWIRRPLGGVVVALAVILGTGAILLPGGGGTGGSPTPTPTPDPTLANVWVNTVAGGSPGPRVGGAGATYSANDAYGRMIDAVAVAECGDVIRVKAGAYGKQGSLTKNCSGDQRLYITGEPWTAVDDDGYDSPGDGVLIDSGESRTAIGGCENPPPDTCAYNTFNLQGDIVATAINVTGHHPIVQVFEDDNTWQDSYFTMYPEPAIRHYISDEPLLLQDGDAGQVTADNPTGIDYRSERNTIRRVKFGVFRSCYNNDTANGCPSNDTGHLELIRLGAGYRDTLIDGVDFGVCTSNIPLWVGCGSGHIFITNCQNAGCGHNTAPRGLTIQNSVFRASPSHIQTSSQAIAAGPPDLDWTLAYNSMSGAIHTISRHIPGTLVVGNTGLQADSCLSEYTWTRNVVAVPEGGTTCGTNTSVGSSTASLNRDADLVPNAGSPAINGGETGGYCTTSFSFTTPGLGSVDGRGIGRPIGSACDAGHAEVG